MPSAVPYLGGKSSRNGSGLGAWIAGILPPVGSGSYIEPFAGMLGVLLQLPKSRIEIVNDIDGRIVNWWRQLRDCPDELLRRLASTPWSREEYCRQLDLMNGSSPMVSAVAVSVVLRQSLRSNLSSEPSAWRRHFLPGSSHQESYIHQLVEIADRIKDVQLECTDAVKLLERTTGIDDAIIYADPPYPSAPAGQYYGAGQLDIPALIEVFSAQKGSVAISGYGDEWDALGWERHEFKVKSQAMGNLKGESRSGRVEVLWTNFTPEVSAPVAMFDLSEERCPERLSATL